MRRSLVPPKGALRVLSGFQHCALFFCAVFLFLLQGRQRSEVDGRYVLRFCACCGGVRARACVCVCVCVCVFDVGGFLCVVSALNWVGDIRG